MTNSLNSIISPNTGIRPASCLVNQAGHLVVGGCDVLELAAEFGTPLWIIDEQTIRQSVASYKEGLKDYPNAQILYAGKSFLCLAMVHLLKEMGLGLDVVSEGELYTARVAGLPAERICMHGNNKSHAELKAGLEYGDVTVVVDNMSELLALNSIAESLGKKARVLLRVIPGVEPDTHKHIKTGQHDSKFGIPLSETLQVAKHALEMPGIDLKGLHAHIGSQALELQPYLENAEIFAELALKLKKELGFEISVLDVGGGLGIKYSEKDQPVSSFEWAQSISKCVKEVFEMRSLSLPHLLIEPGRSLIGTAGVTIYRVGHCKQLPGGKRFVAVDGGMADNPRPITYQAPYTAIVANRANTHPASDPVTIVGRYCEQGDIIINEAYLQADAGDLIAIFGTGAYNYSMASNYNRSPRPACVLVADGAAEIIIERESNDDLLSKDRVPKRLKR
jgi:diaminopimelate decarboxylase